VILNAGAADGFVGLNFDQPTSNTRVGGAFQVDGDTTLGDAEVDAFNATSDAPTFSNLTTMATATTAANRQSGDARWAQNSDLLFGKINILPLTQSTFNTAVLTGSASQATVSFGIDASVNMDVAGSFSRRPANNSRTMGLLAGYNSAIWQTNNQFVSYSAESSFFGPSTESDAVWRTYIAANTETATADLASKGYGIRLTTSGLNLLVVGQVHDGTTLTTSSTLATISPGLINIGLAYTESGGGVLTVYIDGASVGTVSGGPIGGLASSSGPVIGLITGGTDTGGTAIFRTGPQMIFKILP